jgi:hypothetical protein
MPLHQNILQRYDFSMFTAYGLGVARPYQNTLGVDDDATDPRIGRRRKQ